MAREASGAARALPEEADLEEIDAKDRHDRRDRVLPLAARVAVLFGSVRSVAGRSDTSCFSDGMLGFVGCLGRPL